MRTLTSLSVDDVLLPRYKNLYTYVRGSSYNEEIAATFIKHMNAVLYLT